MTETTADVLLEAAKLFKQRANIFDDAVKIFGQMHATIDDAEYIINRLASSSWNTGTRLEDSVKHEQEIPEEVAMISTTLFKKVADDLNNDTLSKLNDLFELLSRENDTNKEMKSLISTII